MGKLVILKIGGGSFEQGFPVVFQVGEESQSAEGSLIYAPMVQVAGALPAASNLPFIYECWQAAYRQLDQIFRLGAPSQQTTNFSVIQDCQQAAQQLLHRFNQWLQTEDLRSIREKWLEVLHPQEPIRVILQTEQQLIQRLPWHHWELMERYAKAEIALSSPTYQRLHYRRSPPAILKILAILGDSQGIDLQADRVLLEQLPNAEIKFLVTPDRSALDQQLWSQPWDILFFAGHSDSQGGMGGMRINATDRLTIPQLKYALQQAVNQGLQLAIFSSCDGLGLARDLAELHIPQIIVMREPVPDYVAQAFLKFFLTAFSQGNSLYASVRSAREQLHGLEDRFPCATWLPMISQNPAECPMSWPAFKEESVDLAALPASDRPWLFNFLRQPRWQKEALKQWLKVSTVSLVIGLSVVGIRSVGLLKSTELFAFDQFLRLRPSEPPDQRLLIVTIDAAERDKYGDTLPNIGPISISDRYLNQLLQKLLYYSPRLIGLDLYRDFPVDRTQKDLAIQYQQNPKIISVCKARFAGKDSIAPPPDIPSDQVESRVGFSDFVTDSDHQLRRHLLAMTPTILDAGIPCYTSYAFSTQLAVHYLQAQGVAIDLDTWRWRDVAIPLLESSSSGFWQIDGGRQIPINYRMTESPALRVSLTEVLSGKGTGEVSPGIIKDRIVLVGVTANRADMWNTPIDPQMPGVVVQAHLTSQLLSAVLDHRPLLRVWPNWVEIIWILGWAIGGGLVALKLQSPVRLAIALLLVSLSLSGIGWILFIQAVWILPVASLVAFIFSGAVIALLRRFNILNLDRSRSSENS